MGDPSRNLPTSLPRELASLRIGACLALLLEDSARPALAASHLPRALLQWPEGLRFCQEWLQLDPALVGPLVWAFRICVLLSLVGLGTRWSLLGAAAIGTIVLPLAQLVGPTVHNHHLFWFLLLLATAGSSSGAIWSVDARLRRVTWTAAGRDRARVVVASGRAMLGIVYFFPGFWKMKSSGVAWFEPQALVNLFHSKWYQFDLLPGLRLDQSPLLLSLGAMGIVLLELSFPLLVLTRRTRTLALIGGLSFHILSAQLLGIAFAPLWLCYGLLVDWARMDAWLRSGPWTPRDRSFESRARRLIRASRGAPLSVLVGILAAGGFLVQGARGEGQSFPWACYPTFQWLVPGEQRDVLATLASGDPPPSYPSPLQARRRTQREWGQVYRLLGSYDDTPRSLRDARCAYAEWLVASGRLPRAAGNPTVVELYEVGRSTVPERWDDPPRTKRLLDHCTLE